MRRLLIVLALATAAWSQTTAPAPAVTAYVHVVSPQASMFASLATKPTFQPVAFVLLSAENVPTNTTGWAYTITFSLADGTQPQWTVAYQPGWLSLQYTFPMGAQITATNVVLTQQVTTATATVLAP